MADIFNLFPPQPPKNNARQILELMLAQVQLNDNLATVVIRGDQVSLMVTGNMSIKDMATACKMLDHAFNQQLSFNFRQAPPPFS